MMLTSFFLASISLACFLGFAYSSSSTRFSNEKLEAAILLNETARQAAGNPFTGKEFYVLPGFQANIRESMRTGTDKERQLLEPLLKVPVAAWVPSIDFLTGGGKSVVKKILRKAKKESKMVTFVVYNLPNRDCGAGASAGGICCSKRHDGSCDLLNQSDMCEDGLRSYKQDFIDPLASYVRDHCHNVPMSFIIEPDALPFLVTSGSAQCGAATAAGYMQGIKYAVKTLHAACPSSGIYLDAGGGGWIGWPALSRAYLERVKTLGITSYLRGFAINTSGFMELGKVCPEPGYCNNGANPNHPCCKIDSCKLTEHWNPGFTTFNYVASLTSLASEVLPGFDPHFVIDTSRNGVGDARKADCGNWCNIRDVGVGAWPSASTDYPERVDAYLWVKPPGESDGCTQILPNGQPCPSYNGRCASADSIGSRPGEPRAPEAGSWFDYQIKQYVKNSAVSMSECEA